MNSNVALLCIKTIRKDLQGTVRILFQILCEGEENWEEIQHHVKGKKKKGILIQEKQTLQKTSRSVRRRKKRWKKEKKEKIA